MTSYDWTDATRPPFARPWPRSGETGPRSWLAARAPRAPITSRLGLRHLGRADPYLARLPPLVRPSDGQAVA
jgi:hypothetical protein